MFIIFGGIKALNIHFIVTYTHAHTHTHICAEQLPKATFLDPGDLKAYKSGENST